MPSYLIETTSLVGGGHEHLLRNETSAPARTVAVQIVPKDAPRKVDTAARHLPV
jgi:hypothetical protein